MWKCSPVAACTWSRADVLATLSLVDSKMAKGKRVNRKGPIHRKVFVDDALFAIVRVRRISRPFIVRAMWAYVKAHKLQAHWNGRFIIPDEKLAAVMGNKGVVVNGFTMSTHIERHLLQK